MASKKIFFFILACLSVMTLSSQQNTPNLSDYVQQNSDKFFFFHNQTIGEWKEMNIQYAQTTNKEDPAGVYTLFSEQQYAFAQLIVVDGISKIYYDTDGDGLLNMSCDFLFVPWWVVWKNSTGKSDANELLGVLETLFFSLAGTAEPFETTAVAQASQRITRDQNVFSGTDRDLFYLLFLYMTLKNDLPKESLNHMLILEKFLVQRAGRSHPLIDFYAGQTAMDMGDFALAAQRFDAVLKLQPDFVPALVLRCLVENDAAKKKTLSASLLKKHTAHWMVVEYYSKLQKASL